MMELAEQLLTICKENNIKAVLKESDSWQILYHLSPVRENLLEWYAFREKAELLEIGAEAGAMTGLFAERVKRVVSLEKNSDLVKVNKQRNQKYKNIEFRIGLMEQLQTEEKFDYITLVGVLENAFEYDMSDNPCIGLLQQCKEHLKENGVLIIAVDNKTGMKYWAGAPEHCSGIPFTGISNGSDMKQSRSFTKVELEHMLQRSHFNQQEFYYPVPDYRFAASLYSDSFLPQRGELRPGNQVYEAGGYQFFEEDLAYDIVCRDGKYPYFAESFLIFAGTDSKIV